jgi:hypothetical protein
MDCMDVDVEVQMMTWLSDNLTRGRVWMTGGNDVAGSGNDMWHIVANCVVDFVLTGLVWSNSEVTSGPIIRHHVVLQMIPIRPSQKMCFHLRWSQTPDL